MAKKRKSRRAKKKKRRTQVRERALPASQERAASAPTARVKATAPVAPDFSQEYRYVISDLKRIGIIAASMLALLVILSFVIK